MTSSSLSNHWQRCWLLKPLATMLPSATDVYYDDDVSTSTSHDHHHLVDEVAFDLTKL